MKSLWIALGWSLLLLAPALAETPEEAFELQLAEAFEAAQAQEVDLSEKKVSEPARPLVEAAGEGSLKEEDIELFKAEGSEAPLAKSLEGGGATLLTIGIALILMFAGIFLMRKWVRKASGQKAPLKIKIIGQHFLGPKKSLAVVRVAGESILIGITDQNITCIKALSLLDEELPSPEMPEDFTSSLQRSVEASEEEEEGFAIAPLAEIKDRVSTTLKSMREI